MRKLIAGFMTALMALLTATTPVLAATQLGSYPTFLKGADNTLSAYVVVGAAAQVEDVIGAVDVASRLAEVGKSTVTQTCSGASGAVTGTSKDTVPLAGLLSLTFPASGVLKTAHYSGLKDSTYSWRGTDYDYREQVDIANVQMSHSLGTNYVNGSEKMVVSNGGSAYKYQFVFDKALAGTGSADVANYTYPINIKLLGKSFSIVGVSSNSVNMLKGSIGTATATTPVVNGDYSVYSDLGYSGASTSSGNWARVIIKDKDGNTVDTLTINQGDNKPSAATGLTIMLTTVRALQDGTVVGADVVVGPTSEGVTKTYDQTADVSSTGTASDKFPGESDWGIQVGTNGVTSALSFASTGSIAVGDVIEVVYKPTAYKYLAAGEKISLPNNYGDLGYEGFNTDKFVTISITPLAGTVSAYNYSADTQSFGNLQGVEIASDVAGSIVSPTNTGYSKAYILYNYSRATQTDVVFIGYYDSGKQKIIVNGSIAGLNTAPTGEYVSNVFNASNSTSVDAFTYDFKVSYGNAGDSTFYIRAAIGYGALLNNITAGSSAGNQSITLGFKNATAATTTQAPSFKLGATAVTTETDEVNVTTEGTSYNAGKKTQDIVDDTGIIVGSTETNGAADKAVLKVPFKALANVVYFGKLGGGVSGDQVSYTSYPSVPITSAVAKLDSEITATEKAKNLITVGGPCVNSVTAAALGLTFPKCGVDSTIPENKGLIKVVDSPYPEGSGKVVVVVAGWEAANTRAASSALQLFDTKLAGVTASAVEVTGTVGAPTVTPA